MRRIRKPLKGYDARSKRAQQVGLQLRQTMTENDTKFWASWMVRFFFIFFFSIKDERYFWPTFVFRSKTIKKFTFFKGLCFKALKSNQIWSPHTQLIDSNLKVKIWWMPVSKFLSIATWWLFGQKFLGVDDLIDQSSKHMFRSAFRKRELFGGIFIFLLISFFIK